VRRIGLSRKGVADVGEAFLVDGPGHDSAEASLGGAARGEFHGFEGDALAGFIRLPQACFVIRRADGLALAEMGDPFRRTDWRDHVGKFRVGAQPRRDELRAHARWVSARQG
jgi:hypothetical protein